MDGRESALWIELTSAQDLTHTIRNVLYGQEWQSSIAGDKVTLKMTFTTPLEATLDSITMLISGATSILFEAYSSSYIISPVRFFCR